MADERTVRIVYFARLRDKIGVEAESLELPASAVTIADLMAHLASLSGAHNEAFADADTIRAAIDQQHAETDAPIGGAIEIAFFPPMTGG